MAKKKASKIVPPIYPSPAPIELEPRKIVAFDPESNTITLEGPTPIELIKAEQQERDRLDLNLRLKRYTSSCLRRVIPHIGDRPDYISPAEWRNPQTRIQLLRELPNDAPAEARDALIALKTINAITKELVAVGDWPDEMDRVICLAIDLGQVLQRGQVQIDHGRVVAAGVVAIKSRVTANIAKQSGTAHAQELARLEYIRRQEMRRNSKDATLRNMAGMQFGEKTRTLATLRRWGKAW